MKYTLSIALLLFVLCKPKEEKLAPHPRFYEILIKANFLFKDKYEQIIQFGGKDFTGANSEGELGFFLMSDFQKNRFHYITKNIDMNNGMLIDINGKSNKIKGCCTIFFTWNSKANQ